MFKYNVNKSLDIHNNFMNNEIKAITSKLNADLELRLKKTIYSNIFCNISIQQKHPVFDVAKLGGNIVVTDNRHISIEKPSNAFKALYNLYINVNLIIRSKFENI